MKTATIREAQHHLSKLIAEVENGEEIVLTRRGKEVCMITPLAKPKPRKVDWKKATAEMDARLGDMPTFDYGIAERLRDEERF